MIGPAAPQVICWQYGILAGMFRSRWLLIVIALLPSILACRAATSLVTSVVSPSSNQTVSSTPAQGVMGTPLAGQPSCPAETGSILRAAAGSPAGTSLPGLRLTDGLYSRLVTYSVQGDSLSDPVLDDVPSSLRRYQRDVAGQQSAWRLFTDLIPRDQRPTLKQFQIITDGAGDVLSAVEQTRQDPRTWVLEVDIADVPDTRNLAFTLLHEFGHLLTLSPEQVPPDLQVFNHPLSQRIYQRALDACPNFFPGEGCSLPDSYINTFFGRFWADLFDEWSSIDNIEDQTRRESRLDSFYEKHKDHFVDSYAATSPTEDIAETWAFYILSPRPAGDTIADRKIRFFEEYPRLASLRGQILSNLCAVHP